MVLSMSNTDEEKGIFAGTDNVIVPAFERLSNSCSPDDPSFSELVSKLYDRIESNCGSRQPSKENWRCTQETKQLRDDNCSGEKLLEKAVAMLSKTGVYPGWCNQVPVASGLIDHVLNRKTAIDLVHRKAGTARFVELKWKHRVQTRVPKIDIPSSRRIVGLKWNPDGTTPRLLLSSSYAMVSPTYSPA
jgi:hypothetical protein